MSSLLAPAVILVEPQMGENIGGAARAMMNCGLRDLRLVSPRDGWPNSKATAMAAHAGAIIEGASVVETLPQAVADSHWVVATTARGREMNKPVLTPSQVSQEAVKRAAAGQQVAILFGRESVGLSNEEVAQANAILTIPLDPANTSLNLAQAVLLFGYEWYQRTGQTPNASDTYDEARANASSVDNFLSRLVSALDETEFLGVPEKRERMIRNIRNIFTRCDLTEKEVKTLHGILKFLRTR